MAEDGAKQTLLELGIADDATITSQVFTSARDWATNRSAELVGKSWDEDGNLIDNPDASMAITDATRDDIREAVADAIEDGDSAAELADTIEGLGAFSEERATMIARTECLLPDTPVDAAVVRAAFRRAYDGDVIEIVTAAGRKLTATPNHPMLTRRGWVAAGELSDTDDLVCDGRKKSFGPDRHAHEHTRPPTVAEIFGALADAMTPERYTSSRFDFHGDGMDGDVDVVRPDGELVLGVFTEIREPSAHLLFAKSNEGGGAAFCPSCSRLLTIDKQPCFCCRPKLNASRLQPESNASRVDVVAGAEGHKRFTSKVSDHYFMRRQSFTEGRCDVATGVLSDRRLAPMTDGDAAPQSKGHSIHLDAHGVSDLFLAEPGPIQACRSLEIDRSALLHEGGSALVTMHAGLHEDSTESLAGDAELLRDDMAGNAGFIEFDRVRFVKRASYSGHVYNLETPYGYFLVAGGAYTGNTIRAHAQGQMSAMRESGVVEQKAWSTANDPDACDECVANEDEGAIDLDDDFQSGDDAPPAHPNCRCNITGYFPEDEGEGEEEEPEEGEEDEQAE